MNQSLTDDEWIKIEKQFFKDYLKWSKSNRKSLAPIYPPELNDSNIGDDEWDYKGNEKLLVDEATEATSTGTKGKSKPVVDNTPLFPDEPGL